MAVTHRHLKAVHEPIGDDYKDVLKRAKAFFKTVTFYIAKYEHEDRTVYYTDRVSECFKIPEDADIYEKVGNRWIKR